MKIAIIGSTGLEIGFICDKSESIELNIDNQIVRFDRGYFREHEVLFFSRNLKNGACPPNDVLYSYIMKAIKLSEVDAILATSVVGSLNCEYAPGDYVIIDQFLDFTKHRDYTIFNKNKFSFVDFTNPYCESLRLILKESCLSNKVRFHEKGCYVGVDGPRYETAAEVKAFGMLGGDVVGMTNIPEVIFARELGLCYASIALVVNYGAGINVTPILRKDCYDNTISNLDITQAILKETLSNIQLKKDCDCSQKNSDIIQNFN